MGRNKTSNARQSLTHVVEGDQGPGDVMWRPARPFLQADDGSRTRDLRLGKPTQGVWFPSLRAIQCLESP
jgi:hypothetical protein